MKRTSSVPFSLVMTSFVMSSLVSVSASAKDIKIGFVEVQKALISVGPGKKARAELEKDANAKRKEIEAEKASFEKARDEYAKKASLMKEEARKKKETDLQAQYMKINMKQAQMPEELGKKEQELTVPIYNKLKTVIADVAKKDGYTWVLEKNAVLYADDDKADITNDVISAFDKSK